MKDNHNLSKEICNHILHRVIASNTVSSLNYDRGLALEEFKLSISIKIEEDGEKLSIPIYAGRLYIGNEFVDLLLCSFSNEESYVVIKMKDCPIYIVDIETGGIYLNLESSLVIADTLTQCNMLLAIEKLYNLHLPIVKSDGYSDLFSFLMNYLENKANG